ncbi:hypothetical protein KW792_02160 [Candidatus Saccharibacteria bacterium]|nr:hypothetical protein [Candidatus Saccharibacteria bacterium]
MSSPYEVALDFGAELNNWGQTNPERRNYSDRFIDSVRSTTVDFLADFFAKLYPEAKDTGAWKVETGFRSERGGDLLKINVFLPPDDRLEDMGRNAIEMLNEVLVSKFAELTGRLTVAIGPA